VKGHGGSSPVRAAVGNDEWLNTEFISTVQQRGAKVIAARKFSSAASAAQAIVDHMRDWINGTPEVKKKTIITIFVGGSYCLTLDPCREPLCRWVSTRMAPMECPPT